MNILDFIFPLRCVVCGRLGRYFCNSCTSTIQIIKTNEMICPICTRPAVSGVTHPRCRTRYSIDGLTSFFRYKGPVQQALKKMKYRFVSNLAKELISLIPPSFLNNLTMKQFDNLIIVPVPLHTTRLLYRGFNQAELLGRLLAKRLNIPIETNILKRIKKTIPQVEMKNRRKRLANMAGVFSVNQSVLRQDSGQTMKQFNNVTMLLFDDVFTTGATMRAAANVLKRGGVKKVWGMTLAHG